jgi:hypothetical protein
VKTWLCTEERRDHSRDHVGQGCQHNFKYHGMKVAVPLAGRDSRRPVPETRRICSAPRYHSSEPRPGSGATVVNANASDGVCASCISSARASRCM